MVNLLEERDVVAVVLDAADAVGEDGDGKAGLVGYLTRLAITEPVTFAGLIGKIMPADVDMVQELVPTRIDIIAGEM